jgi:IS605 OrfB family transposase
VAAFRSFERYWLGRTCHPRFKAPSKYHTIWYPSPMPPNGYGVYRLHFERLYLTKTGHVRFRRKQMPAWVTRPNAKPKRAMVLRRPSGWEARIEFTIPDSDVGPTKVKAVGLDAGLTSLWTLSDGSSIPNPRWMKGRHKQLGRAQRRLARRRKGSSNWQKQLKKVAQIYEDVRRARTDFLHKQSRSLSANYSVIAVESGLSGLRNGMLRRHIREAAWGTFVRFLGYKLAERGGTLVQVNPRNTTTTCSACGQHETIGLDQRTWSCSRCGLELSRDVNAARNILNRALVNLPRGTREVTLEENGVSWGRGASPPGAGR